ncbi:MAG: CoA transferase [Pigmentiphaga sp.]|nr:CoA transferase [Pigmentiphaga sp.]
MMSDFKSSPSGVLHGIRILDLTQMVAGPLCTLLLGDMGADVIKVEPPEGESARHIGVNRPGGESDYYLSMNRNKRGVVLDLKTADGIAALKALAAQVDVLVENFRPGTMERLGLGFEMLRQTNPGLIYCGLSGFGSDGAYRDRPALDPVIQAMSGLMQLTGTPDSGPLKTGLLMSDFVPPLFGAIGILGALRAREQTGIGQRVEVSMLDATVFSMVPREQFYFSTGRTPERLGNAHFQLAPWNTYATQDERYVMVVAHNDKYWLNLLAAIGREELAQDARFATNADRLKNRDVLDGLIAESIARHPLDTWLRLLVEADVLFSVVRDFPDVFSDAEIRRTLIESIEHPSVGELELLRTPIRLETHPVSIRRPPPRLGEHTAEVAAEYGFTLPETFQ